MIDFSGVAFTKKIKTTGVRIKKAKEGTTVFYLSNALFDLQLGDRVLADEQLVEDGKIPVYSANVHEPFGFIDSENLEDYSRDSIIWGIDGDWMVTTIDKNIPFYPTDHCGVLRTDEKRVTPKYLAMALEVEGKLEKFSRNNRASIQRIKSLSVRLPDKKSPINYQFCFSIRL
jgi:type I restriction enzyme M protein